VGKSTICLELIRKRKTHVTPPVTKVIYLYKYLEPELLALSQEDDEVEVYSDYASAVEQFEPGALFIIDDFMTEDK